MIVTRIRPAFTLLAALFLASCTGPGSTGGSTRETGAPDAAARILNASPGVIAADPVLSAFVQHTARAQIQAHCSSCHGEDLTGGNGVPDLTDYDQLWGSALDYSAVGAVSSFQRTITWGIRNRDCPPERQEYGACADTRFSQMPGYGDLDTFTPDQIRDLTEYVQSLSGQPADAGAIARAGENWGVCIECHGQYGEGMPEYGGPNLTDEIALYGNDRDSIQDVIFHGREGACPDWGGTLDAAVIKALAVYLYQLSNQ